MSTTPLVGASGDALFAVTDLAPGRSVRRCIVIGSSGVPGEVRLVADGVSGDLAPYLLVSIAVGTGGDAGSCAGFAGQVAYTGPLIGLTGGPPTAPGVSTGWSPGGGAEARTYQIEVQVIDDNAGQDKSAGATLRWVLVSTVTPAPPAANRPSPTVAASESPRPVTGLPESTSSTPTATVPASTTPRTPEASTPAGDDASFGHDDSPLGVRLLEAAGKLAVQLSRHAAIPLLALLLALLFLAIQDYIDRRDPKLMRAPLTRHRYLTFSEGSGRAPCNPGRDTVGSFRTSSHASDVELDTGSGDGMASDAYEAHGRGERPSK